MEDTPKISREEIAKSLKIVTSTTFPNSTHAYTFADGTEQGRSCFCVDFFARTTRKGVVLERECHGELKMVSDNTQRKRNWKQAF